MLRHATGALRSAYAPLFGSPKPTLQTASLAAQTTRAYSTPGSQLLTRPICPRRSQTIFIRQSQSKLQASVSRKPHPANRRTFSSSHHSHYQRRQYQYNRFQGNPRQQLLYRLVQNARPHHFVMIGVGISGVYMYNTETVEITGRRQFNFISRTQELKMGEESYRDVLASERGKVLPDSHPLTRMVDGVLQRLIPQAPVEGADWRVHVIDNPGMVNAFVLPGGKVFVYTGILPVCKDEDGLAAVLGHEIAHVVAHHPAERVSNSFLTLGAVFLFSLPNSRTQEAEADNIGLMMMSKACFDPRAAVELWARMHEKEKQAPPQFMSTHPSSYNRMEAIQGWLDKAEAIYDDNGCHAIREYMPGFKSAYSSVHRSPF